MSKFENLVRNGPMSKMAVFTLFDKTKIVVDNDLHAKSENKIEFSKIFVSRIGNK